MAFVLIKGAAEVSVKWIEIGVDTQKSALIDSATD